MKSKIKITMKKIIKITWDEIYSKVDTLVDSLTNKNMKIFGMSPDGKIIAGISGLAVDSADEADILVDGVFDGGEVYRHFQESYPEKEYVFFFNKSKENFKGWVEMPWGNLQSFEVVFQNKKLHK